MALPAGLVLQPGARVQYLDGYEIHTESYVGDDGDIATAAAANPKGGGYDSQTDTSVQTSETEKIQADKSRWNVVWKHAPGTGQGGDGPSSEKWSASMAQYEFPLEKYLNPTEAFQVAAWRDADADHKKQFKYLAAMSQTGPYYESLTGKALEVAKKIWAGTEAVLKFYPQATRTGLYSAKKKLTTRAAKLNHIDTEPDGVFNDFDVEWLKSGFDWSQNPDDTWTLTETWIGAPKWDANLYGANAWEFYDPGQQQQGGD